MEMMKRYLNFLEVDTTEKGILQISIYANGTPAHGSTPWLGKNAIEMLLEDLERIRRCFLYASSKEDNRVSLNIGLVSGGAAVNSVPVQANAKLYFRFPAHITSEDIKRRLKGCMKNCELHVDLEVMPRQAPASDLLLNKCLVAE